MIKLPNTNPHTRAQSVISDKITNTRRFLHIDTNAKRTVYVATCDVHEKKKVKVEVPKHSKLKCTENIQRSRCSQSICLLRWFCRRSRTFVICVFARKVRAAVQRRRPTEITHAHTLISMMFIVATAITRCGENSIKLLNWITSNGPMKMAPLPCRLIIYNWRI